MDNIIAGSIAIDIIKNILFRGEGKKMKKTIKEICGLFKIDENTIKNDEDLKSYFLGKAPIYLIGEIAKKDFGNSVVSKLEKSKMIDWFFENIEVIYNEDQTVPADEFDDFDPDFSKADLNNDITVPYRIDLFIGLDVTVQDKYILKNDEIGDCSKAYLINESNSQIDKICKFNIVRDDNSNCYLIADSSNITSNEIKGADSYLVFDISGKLQKSKVGIVSINEPSKVETHLCIDFGTSNTTAGCYFDERYKNNIPESIIQNGLVKLQNINIANFIDTSDNLFELKSIVPTAIYVKDCSDPKNIKYLFGYDAMKKISVDDFHQTASCFLEIKRWIPLKESQDIEISDEKGNRTRIKKEDIVSAYLKFVIKNCENQFKCKFKNVHISAPVKLKDKVLNDYEKILKELGYTLEKEDAIDEGIAVLYTIIDNQRKNKNEYISGQEYQALIIDCGGGTSDLASCKYTIKDDSDDDFQNVKITTEFKDGDVNCGGNKLTYRIMQYMKILYAENFKGNRISIKDVISVDSNSIFSYIDNGAKSDESVAKQNFDKIYENLEERYKDAESIIPTKFSEPIEPTQSCVEKTTNNFYFLWKIAEYMKKEFFKSSSTQVMETGANPKQIQFKNVKDWKFYIIKNGNFIEEKCPNIEFTLNEVTHLLKAEIYYLIRKFLNGLYDNDTPKNSKLFEYSHINISGQSTQIGIFMDSLKEFLPGKMIDGGNDEKETENSVFRRKLFCVEGAISYLHARKTGEIDSVIENKNTNVPISLFWKKSDGTEKAFFEENKGWGQPSQKRRITNNPQTEFIIKSSSENSSYVITKDLRDNYKSIKYEDLSKVTNGKVTQEEIDGLDPANNKDKKYMFVYLNENNWGYDIIQVWLKDGEIWATDPIACSFEQEIEQETFFDGHR